jgi:DNA polymerase I-like protein with 3'-5' exonuclease and polymerase domains
MELRVMADEADEMQLIHDIQNGVDFHQKLADSASITRGVAKAARFSSLYGAGHKKLAKILSLPESKAKSILDELRLQTPNITMYSRRLIKYAETNGCATNWLGRRYFFDSKFAYKFPNYRIQGGCSEILRFAIDSVTKFVSAHRKGNTYLMLPIHDELVLNVDGGDMGLLPTIRVLMIEAYKAKKHLDMDVACAVGNNFADVEAYSLESTAGKTL